MRFHNRDVSVKWTLQFAGKPWRGILPSEEYILPEVRVWQKSKVEKILRQVAAEAGDRNKETAKQIAIHPRTHEV